MGWYQRRVHGAVQLNPLARKLSIMMKSVAVVSQGIRVVETVAVVGVAVVVEGIGLRSSGSGGLGIGGPLAVVVAVETVRHGGESVQRASVHGGHTGDGGNKRVAVVSISISSRLGVS